MFLLETDRLLIRPWHADERAEFAKLTDDPEVTRFVHAGRPYSEEEIDGHYARQARNLDVYGVCMGAVVEKSSERIIGLAGAQQLGTTPDLEIGWVFSRAAWGNGYATEAGAAALQHVLETIGRSRVVAIIDPDNHPSKRVAARLGMDLEGRYTGAQLGHRMPELVVDLYVRNRG